MVNYPTSYMPLEWIGEARCILMYCMLFAEPFLYYSYSYSYNIYTLKTALYLFCQGGQVHNSTGKVHVLPLTQHAVVHHLSDHRPVNKRKKEEKYEPEKKRKKNEVTHYTSFENARHKKTAPTGTFQNIKLHSSKLTLSV